MEWFGDVMGLVLFVVFVFCLFICSFVLFCSCVVVCCCLFAVYTRNCCLTLGFLCVLNVFSNLSLSIECRLLCYVFVYVIVFYLTSAHQASFSLRPTGHECLNQLFFVYRRCSVQPAERLFLLAPKVLIVPCPQGDVSLQPFGLRLF